jgi:DNA primase
MEIGDLVNTLQTRNSSTGKRHGMTTVTTKKGKTIEVISQRDLREPLPRGSYIRAFCHIHGSDHQRSLSIHRSTGWGHCFNAQCNATVLVTELNPALASRLLEQDQKDYVHPLFTPLSSPRLPLALQPVLLHIPHETLEWQQDELRILLALQKQMHSALLHSYRAGSYLKERGIPLEIALQSGVGYLSPDSISPVKKPTLRSLLRRWTSRIVFPLNTPLEQGYIGRTLWRWQPGMDENRHKTLLEEENALQGRREVRRWIKSNPAGWFGCPFTQLAERLFIVEGAFDRLTLLAGGFDPTEVIALAGTALQPEWIPPQVRTLVLALDGDQAGREASTRIATQLQNEGFNVEVSPPPQDHWGKDWNERWQKLGPDGLWPLQAIHTRLRTA